MVRTRLTWLTGMAGHVGSLGDQNLWSSFCVHAATCVLRCVRETLHPFPPPSAPSPSSPLLSASRLSLPSSPWPRGATAHSPTPSHLTLVLSSSVCALLGGCLFGERGVAALGGVSRCSSPCRKLPIWDSLPWSAVGPTECDFVQGAACDEKVVRKSTEM